jgi:hypothetical protein
VDEIFGTHRAETAAEQPDLRGIAGLAPGSHWRAERRLEYLTRVMGR